MNPISVPYPFLYKEIGECTKKNPVSKKRYCDVTARLKLPDIFNTICNFSTNEIHRDFRTRVKFYKRIAVTAVLYGSESRASENDKKAIRKQRK